MPAKTDSPLVTEKHPLWARWAHWINFPLLTVMIWSGILIYWANSIYWPQLPEGFYEGLGLDHHLAEGMAYHFTFMWFFALNGFLYVIYLLFSGQWRLMAPDRYSFKDAVRVILHDLRLTTKKPAPGKFNGAQRIIYTSITVMGLGSLMTGLAIYKPVQLRFLKDFAGGYEVARAIHFYLTLGFILFFFVHILQVGRSGWNNFRAMVAGFEINGTGPLKSHRVPSKILKKRSLRSFGILTVGLLAACLVFILLQNADTVDGLPSPLRKGLEFNERVWSVFLNPSRTDLGHPPRGRKARVNGSLGLESAIDIKNWKLNIVSQGRSPIALSLTLNDLKKLPKTEILTQFKCIEGWSENMSFAGVKFSDLMRIYHLGTHSEQPPDFVNRKNDLYSHVGLETPDGEYYVSIDMKSMLSPQTLLAYEMNGFPLTLEHGAPLRLIIPNKYGVKSLKRVGKILFADQKLRDYWGEQGYDWFIGL